MLWGEVLQDLAFLISWYLVARVVVEPRVASLVMFFITVTNRRLSHYLGTGV